MTVSLIAAVSENGVIGRDDTLPWRLSADLRRFKQLTMGHHLIMGRKTWESLGRPLPGRTIVVVTRNRDYDPGPGLEQQVLVASDVGEALAMAKEDDEPFIAGGAEIYRLALEIVDRLHLTRLHASFEGDTHLPEIDFELFELTHDERHDDDPKAPCAYSFLVYDRKR